MFKKGDEVFSSEYCFGDGIGIIEDIREGECYTLGVRFKNGSYALFTDEGFYDGYENDPQFDIHKLTKLERALK
jgi:hypothetical protein